MPMKFVDMILKLVLQIEFITKIVQSIVVIRYDKTFLPGLHQMNLTITLMSDAFIDQCGRWQGESSLGQTLFIECPGDLRPYRLVRIYGSQQHQLTLCELEVYGKGESLRYD
jgi:hypothetical protein